MHQARAAVGLMSCVMSYLHLYITVLFALGRRDQATVGMVWQNYLSEQKVIEKQFAKVNGIVRARSKSDLKSDVGHSQK